MKAWMSPIVMAPADDPQAADDGDGDEVEVADEHHRRLDEAGHELGAEAGLVELVVRGREPLLDLPLAAERLDQRVAGEGLLDLGVEHAGVPPLGDEAGLGPLGDRLDDEQRQRHGHDRDQRRAAAR